MPKTVQVAFVAATITILAPASLAGGAVHLTVPRALRPALPGTHSVTVQMHRAGVRYAAHRRLVARNVELTARLAHLRHRPPTHRFEPIAGWSLARLRADNARLVAAIGRLTAPAPATVTSTAAGGATVAPAGLQAIAQCESGGNPSAVGGGGAYRGLYQFDQQTWQSVGGSGDPAAASPAEQTRRAATLYARSGSSSWPVCGK
ncbi:MAG: resuscitation-promoting factor RpfE [Solirubrobacteraceae bacterium]|nr:resuscitation-promoting factor RpfE [Solirubrobacteraceae bacterium]